MDLQYKDHGVLCPRQYASLVHYCIQLTSNTLSQSDGCAK